MSSLSSRLKKVTQPVPNALFQKLLTASHVLHHRSVFSPDDYIDSGSDAISVRHPADSSVFFIVAGDSGPALVSSMSEVLALKVSDCSLVASKKEEQKDGVDLDTLAPTRFIHAAIYARFPSINAIVHAQSAAIVPFTAQSSIPLRPLSLSSASLFGPSTASGIPVLDPSSLSKEERSLTLSSSSPSKTAQALSSLLAGEKTGLINYATSTIKSFITSQTTSDSSSDEKGTIPAHPVALIRSHGFVTLGEDIDSAVYRAVNTVRAAETQIKTIQLQTYNDVNSIAEAVPKIASAAGSAAKSGASAGSSDGPSSPSASGFLSGSSKVKVETGTTKYLSDAECKDILDNKRFRRAVTAAWKTWARQVEYSGFYENEFYDDETEEYDTVEDA